MEIDQIGLIAAIAAILAFAGGMFWLVRQSRKRPENETVAKAGPETPSPPTAPADPIPDRGTGVGGTGPNLGDKISNTLSAGFVSGLIGAVAMRQFGSGGAIVALLFCYVIVIPALRGAWRLPARKLFM